MLSPSHLSSHQIGFVSTRFDGTDGVSLETRKWAQVLERLGQHVYYFAGKSDQAAELSFVVPEAHFLHKDVQAIANISYRSLLIHRRPHCEFTNCGAISKMACTNSSTVLFQHSRVILYSSFSRARQSSHTCFFMRYDPIFPLVGGIS
jgi:hypothetical protein